MKCNICGNEYPALRKNHYVSRDATKTGVAAALSAHDEPILYDCFDCPVCGCQNIAQNRKRVYIPCDDLSDEELLEEIENRVIAKHLGITEDQLLTIYDAKNEGEKLFIQKGDQEYANH